MAKDRLNIIRVEYQESKHAKSSRQVSGNRPKQVWPGTTWPLYTQRYHLSQVIYTLHRELNEGDTKNILPTLCPRDP